MALLDTHRLHGPAHSAVGRIVTFAGGVFSAAVDWNDARRTRGQLAKLSEHELTDLGLIRGDIDNIGRTFRR